MERYLGGEEIDTETLIDDLETAVARGSFHPVVPGLRDGRGRAGRAAGTCWSAASRRRWSTPCPGCRGSTVRRVPR